MQTSADSPRSDPAFTPRQIELWRSQIAHMRRHLFDDRRKRRKRPPQRRLSSRRVEEAVQLVSEWNRELRESLHADRTRMEAAG
jgi:hypothetical protein